MSFSEDALKENARTLLVALADCKPEQAKGAYFKAVHMSSTMGKGHSIDLANADPASPRFMLD